MIRRLIFMLCLVTLIPFSVAYADVSSWERAAYLQENPNELAVFVSVDDECDVSERETLDVVKGVLIRSRIKPLTNEEYAQKDLHLDVSVNCLKPEVLNPVWTISVKYGDASYKHVPAPIIYDREFGAFGIGPKDMLEDGIKSQVEDAITAYMEVNFDLGDD